MSFLEYGRMTHRFHVDSSFLPSLVLLSDVFVAAPLTCDRRRREENSCPTWQLHNVLLPAFVSNYYALPKCSWEARERPQMGRSHRVNNTNTLHTCLQPKQRTKERRGLLRSPQNEEFQLQSPWKVKSSCCDPYSAWFFKDSGSIV